MNIAVVATNMIRINKSVRKGTEIFVSIYLASLSRRMHKHKLDIQVTAFASGDSNLPTKIESVNHLASAEDKNIGLENHKVFELALISKAFSMHKKFDLFHINISNGEYILPFARFIKTPIIITMHGGTLPAYEKKLFTLFKNLPHVHYVSISDSQRKQIPDLNYAKTIYHGINAKRTFTFNPSGGDSIIWAGRGIPAKGADIVLDVVNKTKRPAKLFPILKDEHLNWLKSEVIKKSNKLQRKLSVQITFDLLRTDLGEYYQSGRLFLFPVSWEEPFGMVMIESMSCGTPVVAYARGSVPEIVKDGETGFIVNPSLDDIRGDFIIKKTGLEGLCEAVERIYAMSEEDYKKMRKNTRTHVENNFTIDRMTDDYIDLYKKLTRT